MKRFAETAALHAAGEDPLESALPHLDNALDSLRESDRRLIWMRFHEGLSFHDISDRLRQPREAARKATQRAVGRLGQALRRSGVTLSAVTLTAALSETLTSSAPAALAGKLPAAALAAAGPMGGKTLLLHSLNTMTAAKQITTAAVLVAAFAVPTMTLQESGRRRNAASVSAMVPSDNSGAGAASTEKSSGKNVITLPPGAAGSGTAPDILAMLREVPSARDPVRAAAMAAEAMSTMDPALLTSCLESVKSMKPSLLTSCLNLALFQRWTEVAPEAAMDEAIQYPRSGFSLAVGTVTRTWMRRDAAGFTAWLGAASAKDQQRVFHDARETVSALDSGVQAEMILRWSPEAQQLWAVEGPSDALTGMRIALRLPEGETRNKLMQSAASLAGTNGGQVLDWCVAHFEGRDRAQCLTGVLFAWSASDGRAARDWYLRQAPGTVPVMALANAGAVRDDALYAEFRQGLTGPDQGALDLARVEMMENRQGAERISGLPPGTERTGLYGRIAERWVSREPAEASAWVDSLPAGPERDRAAEGIARTIGRADTSSAMIWAESIADEQQRHRTLTEIWRSWRARDESAATRWLRDGTGISRDSRAVIEALEAAAAPPGS